MKKRFISVAAFCALLAAPVFVGCSDDYDDDITNLQGQIDELRGSAVTVEEAQNAINEAVDALRNELNTAIGEKANNADVIALQEAVRDLNEALANKADEQTVNDLVQQVQDLAERVDAIEDNSLTELRNDLTEGLEGLRQAYEEADQELQTSLNNKAEADEVANLQTRLSTVETNLQGALNDLATLKGDDDATALLNKINNLVDQYNELSNQLADKASQETVNGMNETLNGLNETVGNLNESLAGLNGTVGDIQGDVEDLKANLVDYVNKSELETLQGQVDGLLEQLNALPTNADVADAIQEKIDAMGELVSVNAFEQYQKEISGLLGGLTDRIAACESRLDEVEDMAANNAQDIIDLTNRITSLEDILEGFSSNPGGDVSETVLGEIVALTNRLNAIDTPETGALAQLELKYNNMNTTIGTLQAKLTETQLNALNDIANWDSEKNGSIVSVLNKVIELEEALNANTEEGEPAFDLTEIATQLGNLQSELDELGLMTKMIQSIVFVPESFINESDGSVTIDRRKTFSTLQLYHYSTTNSGWKTVAENREQTIRFRISPATLTKEDIEKNYDITFFQGETIVRNSLAGESQALQNVKIVSVENGILTLSATCEPVGNDNSYKAWALSARVTPKADVEGNEKYTDIFSDYFVVDNRVDRVTSIKVETDENDGVGDVSSYSWPYSSDISVNFAANQKLIGTTNGVDRIDLGEKYPTFVPNITYSSTGDDYYFNFNNGLLSLNKEHMSPSAIGQKATVSVTVTANGINNSYVTTFNQVSIANAIGRIEIAVSARPWSTSDQMIYSSTTDLNQIMAESGLKVDEFWTAVGNGTITNDVNGIEIRLNRAAGTLEIWQKATTNIYNGNETFVFDTDATGNDYTIQVNVTGMTDASYEQLEITRDELAWTETGDYIGLLPIETNTSIKLTRDLRTIFSNYADVKAKATANGGSVAFRVYANGALANGFLSDQNTVTVTPSNYNGEELSFELVLIYGTKEFVVTNGAGNIKVQDLSGSWVVNKTQTFDPLNRTMNTTDGLDLKKGFEWKDYEGETMWKEGTSITTNPLSKFGLTQPTFEIVEGNSQYITLNPTTGELNFSINTENNFLRNWTVVIEVKANSKWGEVEGLEGNNRITVTIPAGTYTRAE